MLRLKELREEKQLNMKQAAKALGIPYTTYISYEKGEREPNSEMLISLADFFNCSIDYLLGRSNDRIEDLAPNAFESWLGETQEYGITDFSTSVYQVLKRIREENGIDISPLAELIGVSTEQYARFEEGKSRISSEQAKKICEFLGTSVSALIDYMVVPKEFFDSPEEIVREQQEKQERQILSQQNLSAYRETKIIEMFRLLNSDGQKKVYEYAKDMTEVEKYIIHKE